MPRRKVSLFYNPAVQAHTHPWPHIEKCTRASNAYEHLKQRGLIGRCVEHVGRAARDDELLTVHSQRHIDEISQMSAAAASDPNNRQLREPDGPGGIYYSPESESAARLAAGCVVDAALAVLQTDAPASPAPSGGAAAASPAGSQHGGNQPHVSFALVRPPGHHAGYDDTPGHRAEGFCFFNSVAVAAGVALRSGAAQRVAIVDYDVHHGNGTQQIFYSDPRVLYISLHRFGDHWYPETGAADEVGAADGVGRNVNVPWPENWLGDTDYAAAMSLIVLPILASFDPDLLLISAGFDAADGDAQGKMRITPDGFGNLTASLLRGAAAHAARAGRVFPRLSAESSARPDHPPNRCALPGRRRARGRLQPAGHIRVLRGGAPRVARCATSAASSDEAATPRRFPPHPTPPHPPSSRREGRDAALAAAVQVRRADDPTGDLAPEIALAGARRRRADARRLLHRGGEGAGDACLQTAEVDADDLRRLGRRGRAGQAEKAEGGGRQRQRRQRRRRRRRRRRRFGSQLVVLLLRLLLIRLLRLIHRLRRRKAEDEGPQDEGPRGPRGAARRRPISPQEQVIRATCPTRLARPRIEARAAKAATARGAA